MKGADTHCELSGDHSLFSAFTSQLETMFGLMFAALTFVANSTNNCYSVSARGLLQRSFEALML
jgi:hypothetical protein